MRPASVVVLALVPALLAVSEFTSRRAFTTVETARIRTHLATGERTVRARDVSGLSPAQRAARARNLDVLHQYWTAGVFPTNTDFPGQRVPYFIDRSGVRCAMAYLIEQSGRGDFVARVAATQNNARIRDLKGDPELVAWLDENGLTAAEAARIQPSYDQPAPPPASTGFKTTTTASVGLNTTTIMLNVTRTGLSSRLTGAMGILSGVSGILAGAPNLGESGQRRTLGYVNAGVGAASIVLGVHRLTARRPALASTAVAPWIDERGAPGLSLSLRF